MNVFDEWAGALRQRFEPPRPPAWPDAVLIICTGNICRSPLAEGALAAALAERGLDVQVESAGTGAPAGCPADPWTLELLSERGVDLTAHMARQVNGEMLRRCPLVLSMEESHSRWLRRRFRLSRGQLWRFCEWDDIDVPDPVGGGRADFEEALALIDAGIAGWMDRCWQTPARP